MKKAVFLATFLAASLLVHAQNDPALYSAASGSVVYLLHTINLSSSDSARPELWKRYEKLAGKSVLDVPLSVASGSGFFLDVDGTILTNRHVVTMENLPRARASVIWWMDNILDKDFSAAFSSSERVAMQKDFQAMVLKARLTFQALLGTRNLGVVTEVAVAAENEPDLAVVRVTDGSFRPLRLAASPLIGPNLVGARVFSLGCPFNLEPDVMHETRAVMMRQGTLSAFRKKDPSLEHTAALGHGSSGGPLMTPAGVVVGVNTAGSDEKSTSLAYAIDSVEVVDFLRKKGLMDIVLWNQRLPDIVASSASDSSGAGDVLSPQAVSVLFTSEPSGATVVADGRDLGTTPLTASLPEDTYNIQLRQRGQWYENVSMEVRGESPQRFSFAGRRAYAVGLDGMPPDSGAVLRFDSSLGTAIFRKGDDVALPSGDWNLTVEGDEAFDEVVVHVRVQQEALVVDLAPFQRTGSLRIGGLDSKARIWVDRRPFPNPGTDTLVLLPGVHAVYVWEEQVQPFDRLDIPVRADRSSNVTWERKRGHDAASLLLGCSGGGAGVVGIVLLGVGVSDRNTFFSVSGGLLLVCTAVLEWQAAMENERYESQRKYMLSLQSK
ncbi:MAG TPA: trypsin-like peptidase domain-containing protein [Spirochaetia bacterium]|nr:trypsin-like peptidase domain-containing protein [Spirochaetia bacterium]